MLDLMEHLKMQVYTAGLEDLLFILIPPRLLGPSTVELDPIPKKNFSESGPLFF
jgi:hypothetical protein